MLALIKKHLQNSIAVKEKILADANLLAAVEKVVTTIVTAYTQGKKVILFGNGGSAADAQHIAGEFVGRFYKERKSLPALALQTNTSVVTAIANDYGYDAVFARLDKVQSPLWVDELRAPNQSISTCAVFESGTWSGASECATWPDHPRDVFGMCVGKMSRLLIPSASSSTTAKCNAACRVGKRSAKKHLESV